MVSGNDRDRLGRRAAGFCTERACASHATPVRLDERHTAYTCGQCGAPGRVVREQLERTVAGDVVDEVQVAYGYDPVKEIYTFLEVAQEPALLGRHCVVTLRTPLIRHPQVARTLAEILLARLNARLRRLGPALRPTRAELISEGWKVLF